MNWTHVSVVLFLCAWLAVSCGKEESSVTEVGEQALAEADARAADACAETGGGEVQECHYQRLARQNLTRDFLVRERLAAAPIVKSTVVAAGDPLKKAVYLEEEEEVRDTDMAKELKKKGVIAVLDSKMKKNTSLSKLLG